MAHELYNNLSYDNGGAEIDSTGWTDGVVQYSHNSWDGGVTVTDDDFESLDLSVLDDPRQADGSLPDISLLHLADGSDLIDAGTDVGLDYDGAAPDIGIDDSNWIYDSGASEGDTPDEPTSTGTWVKVGGVWLKSNGTFIKE